MIEKHVNRLPKLSGVPGDKQLNLLELGSFDSNQERQCHSTGAANDGDVHHVWEWAVSGH